MMKTKKLMAFIVAFALILSSLSGVFMSVSAVNPSEVQKVIAQIDALTPTNTSSATLTAINAANTAYQALSAEDKAAVTNFSGIAAAYNTYYNAVADENNGRFAYLNFENGTGADIVGRMTATIGSQVQVVNEGKLGSKSISITNTNSLNSSAFWESDVYDPFLYSKNGASMSMWVNIGELVNSSYLFSYGFYGHRFFIGYESGSLKVSTRNNDSNPTSELVISDTSQLLNKWTLLTITCDANRLWSVYFNDKLVGSSTLVYSPYDLAVNRATRQTRANTAWTSYYSIGACPYWSTNNNMKAKVDDFAIYNSVLDAQQIAKIYDPSATPDMTAINAVIGKIDALDLNNFSSETLSAIAAAWTSYNALSALNKTYVSNFSVLENAYSTYYNNEADKNGGKFAYFDFEDGSAKDVAGRVTASMGSSTSVVNEGKYGSKSVSISNSKSTNSMVGWKSDLYDPLLYSKDGASISMWVNISSLVNDAPIFSYGFWGFRFYLGYTNGNLLVGARNYDTTTSEFTVPGLSDLIGADWTLLTVTCDANKNYKVYFNDKLVGSTTLSFSLYDLAAYGASTPLRSTTELTRISYYAIACAPYWSDRNNMVAKVDDFGIYNKALSAAQVAMLYNNTANYDPVAVKNVTDLINAIPTADNENFFTALKTAETAYNNLNEYEQADIANYALLENALKIRNEKYPAILYRFEGSDISKNIIDGNKILLLINKGVDLTQVNASAVISDNSTIQQGDLTVWDMSAPFEISVTNEMGGDTTYTVTAYSAGKVSIGDRATANTAQQLCKNLPVYLYRSDMNQAKAAIEAFKGLTDLQKLLVDNSDRAVSAAARYAELQKSPIRITCVGSSTCYGSGAADAATQSYPAQMGKLLGENYVVTNVGVPGTTVVSTASVGIYSYMGTSEYQLGLASKPDIVMMFVGSNDAEGGRWNSAGYKDQFIKDYTTMLNAYRNLDSHPEVILCYPYQSFSGDRATYIPQIMSIIDTIAAEYKCDIVDMYTLTDEILRASDWKTYFGDDKLHPNAAGYAKIAKLAYDFLTDKFDALSTVDIRDIKVGGNSLAGFDAGTDSYTVAYNGNLPEISAEVNGDYTVKIVQPTAKNPVGYVYVESKKFECGTAYQLNFQNDSESRLKEQIELVKTALSSCSVSNSTTAAYVITAVKDALTLNTVAVDWKGTPTITPATEEAAGSITGTLAFTFDIAASELEVNLTIPKLNNNILGDLDGDKQVDVSDVVKLRSIIMSGSATEQQIQAGDFDKDGKLTVTDVVALRSYIMKGTK